MRRLLTSVAAAAGAFAVLAVGVVAWGATMPATHTAAGERFVAARPQAVYARIADPGRYPRWRTGLSGVRVVDARHRVEEGVHGTMPYRFAKAVAPRSLETVIDSSSLPFSGTWTFQLAPARGGTLVRITERGTVPSVPMRALARLFAPPDETLRRYLADLEASFSHA